MEQEPPTLPRRLEDFELARPRIIRKLTARLRVLRVLEECLCWPTGILGLVVVCFPIFWLLAWILNLVHAAPRLADFLVVLPLAAFAGGIVVGHPWLFVEKKRRALEITIARLIEEHRTLTGSDPDDWPPARK